MIMSISQIVTVIESNMAQKATSQAEYERHVKKAIIYNICTYALLIPFAIIMKILETHGFIK